MPTIDQCKGKEQADCKPIDHWTEGFKVVHNILLLTTMNGQSCLVLDDLPHADVALALQRSDCIHDLVLLWNICNLDGLPMTSITLVVELLHHGLDKLIAILSLHCIPIVHRIGVRRGDKGY